MIQDEIIGITSSVSEVICYIFIFTFLQSQNLCRWSYIECKKYYAERVDSIYL